MSNLLFVHLRGRLSAIISQQSKCASSRELTIFSPAKDNMFKNIFPSEINVLNLGKSKQLNINSSHS